MKRQRYLCCMKFLLIIFCLPLSFFAVAQNFNGTWEGKLKINPALRIVFIFAAKPGEKITATLQSPDQSNMLLPMDTCFAKNDSIFVTAKKMGISFKGKLVNDHTITGIFTQGINIELHLEKVEKVSEPKRPQTPIAPFTYNSSEVKFYNADKSLRFAGTLTWPAKDSSVNYFREPIYPAVILISGSGPQDRDETLFNHKPFAVIANYLTNKGFAVLRTDDRGVAGSTGNFAAATSADFANDAEAAIDFLKKQPQVDTAHIGLIGHSEGGMIAPMVAARRKDVQNIVLLAGPGVPIMQLMAEQVEAVSFTAEKNKSVVQAARQLFTLAATEILRTHDTLTAQKNAVKAIEKWAATQDEKILRKMNLLSPGEREANIKTQVRAMKSDWFRYFLAFDPQPYLSRLSCNVLALNGSKDIQVLAASNLAGIKESLKKGRAGNFEVKELPGLNHLFQTCKTCTVPEYAVLEESFSPLVLAIIGDWLMQYGR
jgi:uncharacterized protein